MKKGGSGFFAVALLAVVGVIVYSVKNIINTAKNLSYKITRLGIYQLASGGNLVFRVRIKFTNAENTPLTVQSINLAAYLNSITTTSQNGDVIVQSEGDYLATLKDDNGFVIAANADTTKDFYISVSWADLGKLLLFNVVDIINFINNNNFNQMLQALISKPILIKGNVKAEGFKFPITTLLTVTDDR